MYKHARGLKLTNPPRRPVNRTKIDREADRRKRFLPYVIACKILGERLNWLPRWIKEKFDVKKFDAFEWAKLQPEYENSRRFLEGKTRGTLVSSKLETERWVKGWKRRERLQRRRQKKKQKTRRGTVRG